MITRVVQRKRPRRSAMLAIWGSAIAALGLFAVVALATVTDSPTADGCDIQIGNKNQTDICTTEAGAQVRYIGDSNQTFGSSGTGTFSPFVRLQGSPTERGYNTDGTEEFSTKVGTWTHAILVSEIPVRTEDGCVNCWELFVDINDGNSNKPISLNDMEIWFTEDAELSGYGANGFAAPATKEYDFAGNILINDVNQGSGRGDVRYMVPRTGITIPTDCNYGNPLCETYFVLYSSWGVTPAGFPSDGGFEEWKVKIYPTPPDVSVAKSPDAGTVNAGSNAVFTIVVTNNGPIAADNVTLSDVLPNSGLSWTVGGANAASCAGTNPHAGGTTLTCNFGTIPFPGSRTITLTSPTDASDCGTINNTVTVSATGDIEAANNTDTGSITVQCGAIQVTKTAKHKDTSGDTSANLVATFTITGPSPSTATQTVSTGADGIGCLGGLAFGSYEVEETTVPDGYAAPVVPDVAVDNVASCADATFGGEAVAVENTPLTDVTWSVDSQVDGATQTIVTCYDSAGEVIDGYPITIEADEDDGDGTATLPDLFPTAAGTVTVSCDFEVDP